MGRIDAHPPPDRDGSAEGGLQQPSLNESHSDTMGNRLYIGNLSFSADSTSLRDLFAKCGEVTDVHIVQDRETGQSRGFGFITMGTSAEAAKAISTLDGSQFDGRSLRVNEAEERQSRGGGGGGGGGGGRGGGGGGRGGGRW